MKYLLLIAVWALCVYLISRTWHTDPVAVARPTPVPFQERFRDWQTTGPGNPLARPLRRVR